MSECVLVVTPAELAALPAAVFDALARHLLESVSELVRGTDPGAVVTLRVYAELI